MEKLHAAGCTLWAATAYKGADGPGANLPDTGRRQIATQAWVELTPRFALRGVFATGWSRYASGRIQVTPLDGALDSLVNTAVILHEGHPPAGGIGDCMTWLDAAGAGLEEALRGRIDAPWPRFYHEARRRPVEDAAMRLRARLLDGRIAPEPVALL
ncbi:hypothetical protein OpiT1DRAFT_00450 [Opitutaceae bacterium TAV1]|nr:hypothetical protein OpiT1DRAFT_00450 [Opitutaceae bacterium TAV1]